MNVGSPTNNSDEVNIYKFYSTDALNLIDNTVNKVRKNHKQIITPKDLALETLYKLSKIHTDKISTILESIDEVQKSPDLENLKMTTQRYIFYSPELQIVLLNAFIKAQKEGLTDVSVHHIICSLCDSTIYKELAKCLKETLAQIENRYVQKIILNDLEDEIKAHIIGQDDAIKSVVNAIKSSKTILKDQNKPVGSFLF